METSLILPPSPYLSPSLSGKQLFEFIALTIPRLKSRQAKSSGASADASGSAQGGGGNKGKSKKKRK